MKQKAYAEILLAATLWGCIGLFVRPLTAWGFTQIQIVLFRSAGATLILLIVLLCTNKSLLKIRLKDLWCFVGTGVVSLLLFNVCYFNAMQHTTLSVAAVLLYTAPAFVMVLSAVLFGECFTMRKILALCVMTAGCVLVTGVLGGGQILTLSGILYGLGAGVGYALYSIFGRYAIMRGYKPFTITFYTFLLATLGSVPFFGTITVGDLPSFPLLTMVILAFGGVSCVLPYVFYTRGLQTVDNGTASVMATVEPAVATVVSLVVFQEPMGWGSLLGMGLIFIGIVLIQTKTEVNYPA